MSGTPDYGAYHLHELQRALAQIDEAARPEEARLIREYIARGGYAYPREAAIAKVAFVNPAYKWTLVSLLGLLALFNLAAFALTLNLLALIPLVLQGTLLLWIFQEHKHARALIKLWCALMIASGAFGFLAMAYAPDFEWARLADQAFAFGVGLAFLLPADRCVSLVPVGAGEPARHE